jgi:hypothetical protein
MCSHRSAGILSLCHHLLMRRESSPSAAAMASRVGQSSIMDLKLEGADMGFQLPQFGNFLHRPHDKLIFAWIQPPASRFACSEQNSRFRYQLKIKRSMWLALERSETDTGAKSSLTVCEEPRYFLAASALADYGFFSARKNKVPRRIEL